MTHKKITAILLATGCCTLTLFAAVYWNSNRANSVSVQSETDKQSPQSTSASLSGEDVKTSKLEADAANIMVVFSSSGVDRIQKEEHIDPKLREITPIDDIVRIELAGQVTKSGDNYYSAPGKIFLLGAPNPVVGKFFFTYLGNTLVLTSDRSLE